MTDSERLLDLLDGRLSADELKEIESDPVLRSLAIRIYGDSVRDVIGDEPIIDDVDEIRSDVIELTSVELIVEDPDLASHLSPPAPIVSSVGQRRNWLIALGSLVLLFDLFNVLAGIGLIIGTCPDPECTASRMKLNILDIHRMNSAWGWSETGSFGVLDYLIIAGGSLLTLIGVRRRSG